MERTWRLNVTFTTGAPASARAGCFGSRKGLVAAAAAAAESHQLCSRSRPAGGSENEIELPLNAQMIAARMIDGC